MIYKALITSFFLMLMVLPPKVEVISWRNTTKLTWNNFKAKAKADTDVVAVTASGITFEYSVKETATRIVDFSALVEAHFYPKKSWVNRPEATDHILAHEQLHFDITELHVRKFRFEISKLRITNNLKKEMQRLHTDINNQLAATQARYDAESNNSINKEKQEEWKVHIQLELNKYADFASRD